MNLQDFYNNSDGFLKKLNKNGKELGFLNPEYKFEIGNPVGIPNMTLARMYELLLTSVIHLCPNKLVGASMAIGDFFNGNGQELLMPNMNVCTTNFVYLHLGRSLEDSLSSWELIKEEAYGLSQEVRNYLKISGNEELNSELDNFFGYAGFSFVGTPSKLFVNSVKKLLDIDFPKPVTEKVESLIKMCEPYANIASDVMKIRSLLGSKGAIQISNGMLEMSSPSASGGASWATMMPSNNLYKTIPNPNNMIMVLSSSNAIDIAHIGPSSSISRVGFGTFLLPTDFVTEIKNIMDASEQNFDDYIISLSDTEKVIWKKAQAWQTIQTEVLQDFLKTKLLTLIGSDILGSLIKVDDESKTIYFSPIVPSSMLNDYESDAAIMNFDAVIADFGNSVALPKSVFGKEIEQKKIIAFQ